MFLIRFWWNLVWLDPADCCTLRSQVHRVKPIYNNYTGHYARFLQCRQHPAFVQSMPFAFSMLSALGYYHKKSPFLGYQLLLFGKNFLHKKNNQLILQSDCFGDFKLSINEITRWAYKLQYIFGQFLLILCSKSPKILIFNAV